MSLQVIQTQVKEFLKSTTPEVIAISGAWGVGKTYTWEKLLKQAKEENCIVSDKYAYVSLFGINSLEKLKQEIFLNAIDKDAIGNESSFGTLRRNLDTIINAAKKLSGNVAAASGAPVNLDFVPGVEIFGGHLIREYLICIDDLERRGSGLSIGDVLGLVSRLKEKKQCKIVLLLNDDQKGMDEYKRYHEKVIDSSLKFLPTAAESAYIVFDDASRDVTVFTEKLNITNIRILRKIARIIKLAEPYLKECQPEIVNQVNQSLVLFSWCHFCSEHKDVPDLEFTLRYNPLHFGKVNPEVNNEQYIKWEEVLKDYGHIGGYVHGNEHDHTLNRILADAVRNGYFSENELKDVLHHKNQLISHSKLQREFTDAWLPYSQSFSDNQEEVVSSLSRCIEKNVQSIFPHQLNQVIKLFRNLEESSQATELISFYIHSRKDEPAFFDLKNNRHFTMGEVVDPEILTRFEEVSGNSAAAESVQQVLARVSKEGSGWYPEDKEVLANATVEEYYKFFKSENGSQLPKYVRFFTKNGFISVSGDSGEDTRVGVNALKALLQIAEENRLNHIRLTDIYRINADNRNS